MQLSLHALPAEQVLQQPSTGNVDQGIGASGWLMIDPSCAGIRTPAISKAATIRNMMLPQAEFLSALHHAAHLFPKIGRNPPIRLGLPIVVNAQEAIGRA